MKILTIVIVLGTGGHIDRVEIKPFPDLLDHKYEEVVLDEQVDE